MTAEVEVEQLSRVERRKLRTRASLVRAAQRIFAEAGTTEASIQEITDAADVGFGSFYNHFGSKTELFEVAVTETLEAHATWLATTLADVEDPAEVFTTSMRLTGRLAVTRPLMARIVMHSMGMLLSAPKGHVPHARHDLEAAVKAGKFVVEDVRAALACAAGGIVAALQILATDETVDAGQLTDAIVLNVLLMFRVEEQEARRLVGLPLPDDEPPLFTDGFLS